MSSPRKTSLTRLMLAFPAVGALMAFLTPMTSIVQAQDVLLNVHVHSSGAVADWYADPYPAFSADGRYAVFGSTANNLVDDDPQGNGDVFVHDLATRQTVMVCRAWDGSAPDDPSQNPSISEDGRFVVFASQATNLITPAPFPNTVHIYRHDRDADNDGVFDEPGSVETIIVSVNSAGDPGDGQSTCGPGSVSADGDVIVFESESTNLAGPDANGTLPDCFVHTVSSGVTVLASQNSAGTQGSSSSQYAAISGDGTTVAFLSVSADLIVPDANGIGNDTFVRHLPSGATVRANVSTGDVQSNGWSGLIPTLSYDGSEVAFTDSGDNLLGPGGDTNAASDVFVRNLTTGITTRVSVTTGGGQANGGSGSPALSSDGTLVAFESLATNLVLPDANASPDVFRHNRITGETIRISETLSGVEGNQGSFAPGISPSGSHVGFYSVATNLVTPEGPGADIFVLGPPVAIPPPAGTVPADKNPVTFSVNGPVDPHTEGIRDARGSTPTTQDPVLPGNPDAFGIRSDPVPQANGLFTPNPGDVKDYFDVSEPSEAVMFQSPPETATLPAEAPPDGTNNQVLESRGMGLARGPGLPPMDWIGLSPLRDNVDAFSFGTDFFPGTIVTGLAPGPYPDPPLAADGDPLPGGALWEDRDSTYKEPVVLSQSDPISFRFSVDAWATGAAGTDVSLESGGSDSDAGSGLGPWTSPGDAAGDVFGTPLLTRVGGVTVGLADNYLVHDNVSLALAPDAPPLEPMEDDIDALECVGRNGKPWYLSSALLRPGDLHARLTHVGPAGLAAVADSTVHQVSTTAPVFFSVSRNSPGQPNTAVRSQFVITGSASGDIFVAVPDPKTPGPGNGFNLLFIDEKEIGLGGDDLDGLILWIDPDYRRLISDTITSILAETLWSEYIVGSGSGAYVGDGMTLSITKLLDLPTGAVKVGFSVTTDSKGFEYTGVDWEAGAVGGGESSAAGDIFYSEVKGGLVGPNFLWFEAEDIGLDPGSWINGTSTDLAALTDNLDGLDSIDEEPEGTSGTPGGGRDPGASRLRVWPAVPNPMSSRTAVRYVLERTGVVRIRVFDAQGRLVQTLLDGVQPAGEHVAEWEGTDRSGHPAARGIYLIQFESGGQSRVRKVVLMKE